MSIGVAITQNDVTPALARVLATLGGDRTQLNRAIANGAQEITRRHLVTLSRQRHDSARRLGAKPTGHLGRAAESVAMAINQSEAAVVTITSPGFSRVAHDLDIAPVNGNWLTIPIHTLAYGRTAWEVSREIGVPLFRPGAKGNKKKVLAAVETTGRGKNKKQKLVCFFALSTHVRQKQDRTLLPTDTEYLSKATDSAREFLKILRRVRP